MKLFRLRHNKCISNLANYSIYAGKFGKRDLLAFLKESLDRMIRKNMGKKIEKGLGLSLWQYSWSHLTLYYMDLAQNECQRNEDACMLLRFERGYIDSLQYTPPSNIVSVGTRYNLHPWRGRRQ